jgi:hypothetical protein
MKKVALIIVNYNGKKYLPNLFGSIFKYPPEKVRQEIIVVDNDSNDGSDLWLIKNYPKLTLLKQQKNLGFAEGNNVGIKYAVKNGFDYVMLLNQDIVVSGNYLDQLVATAESDQQIAAVQPKIRLYPEKELINSAGNIIHFLGFGYTRGHKLPDSQLTITNSEVNYCSGAAVLYKLSILKKVGLFNSYFFMYHEDLDLGWRLSLAGYQNVINPAAVVYHQYEFSRSIKKFYYMERNRYLTIFQNYRIGTILLILPALIFMELGLFAWSFKNGWWTEKIKVYVYFLNPFSWAKILRVRRNVQRLRLKKDRQVVRYFSGKIDHQEINSPIMQSLVNPVFNLYWQTIKNFILW